MLPRLPPWTLALALLAPAGACKDSSAPAAESASPADAGLPDRDPSLARKLVKEEGALLLDVRTDEEWNEGHLDGATHIPIDQLESRLPEIEKAVGGDKSKPIVVYCKSGGRAGKAKKLLLEKGYQKVTNLGGMSDWCDAC